jgi:hypothetical protein
VDTPRKLTKPAILTLQQQVRSRSALTRELRFDVTATQAVKQAMAGYNRMNSHSEARI